MPARDLRAAQVEVLDLELAQDVLGVVVAVHAEAGDVQRHQRLDPRAVEVAEAEHRVDVLLAGERGRVDGRALVGEREDAHQLRSASSPASRNRSASSMNAQRIRHHRLRALGIVLEDHVGLVAARHQRGHRRGGDEPRPQCVGGLAEILADRLCEPQLELAHVLQVAGGDRGRLAPQPCFQPRGVGVPAELLRGAPDPRPQRLERRGARRPLGQRAVEVLERRLELREHHLLLGGEVGEEGARRDVGRGGDVGDRRRLEAALGEQAHRGVVDRLARLLLLAFSQSFRHGPEF